MNAQERIDTARKSGLLKAFDYMSVDVLCKGCGAKIGKYNQVPVTIEFDDGSAHETPMCRGCAGNKDKDFLEALYAADLAQWAKELGGVHALREAWVERQVK